jgi:hypothetical protein
MRICRITRTPRGLALLVGVVGSRQLTLTRLTAYEGGGTTFQWMSTTPCNTTTLMDD